MAARILLAGIDTHQFGVVGVDDTYGTVLSADLTEKADEYIFEDNNGDAAAVLLHNHTVELELELLFSSAATVLTIGAQLDFPLGSIKGNVTQIKRSEKNKDGKKITVTAKHWKSLGNVTPTTLS